MGKILQFGEDSRLKGYAGRVTHAILPLERTYCANCGRPWGWASEDASDQIAAAEIIVFCEECFEALNAKHVAQGASPADFFTLPYQRIPETDMTRLGLVEERIR
jgi:hypothetical protein